MIASADDDTGTNQTEYARAFNLGSDARLAGRRLGTNPYHVANDRMARRAWIDGWKHVDLFWGIHARGRAAKLMEVK